MAFDIALSLAAQRVVAGFFALPSASLAFAGYAITQARDGFHLCRVLDSFLLSERRRGIVSSDAAAFKEWASMFAGKLFVKIAAYIDESGTHDRTGAIKGSRQVIVVGLVAWRDDWAKFCDDWQAVLAKYGVPYFHFSEWALASAVLRGKRAANAAFEKNPYRSLDLKSLDALLHELAAIAGGGNKVMVGGYVNTEKFHKAKSDPKYRNMIPADGDPYAHCLNQFFERFPFEVREQWRYWKEPVSFFFDQNDDPKWQHSVLEAFQRFQKKDSRLKELVFANKKDAPHFPLQAADLIAYRMRQIAGHFLDYEVPSEMPELDRHLFKSTFKIFADNPATAIAHWLSHEMDREERE